MVTPKGGDPQGGRLDEGYERKRRDLSKTFKAKNLSPVYGDLFSFSTPEGRGERRESGHQRRLQVKKGTGRDREGRRVFSLSIQYPTSKAA